ncbi:thiamine pyrophosphate-binding protein [Candidatus Entotheonella palauensis]|uniref:thiamine pyrophosphate-binding protein n=1 Tax=Candidatus Entotheonella palauensis TaxID=93172 RepID=UPI000B7EB681|nr:thiamine pyrophosphate-binding protein [Candidatus Entotheonella palauensis]
MTTMSGAEAMVRMLQLHGVKHIFGLCGDTSLPFYDALFQLDHGMQHILARDERSAAYMADVYARLSGRVGVCEGPSGGGATYILPGLVEANDSSSPLLAITTDVSVASRGKFPLTELDQRALFQPVTKWNAMIDLPMQIPLLVRTAFQRMTTGKPGSTHLGFPFDVQKGDVDSTQIWADAALGQVPAYRVEPPGAEVERMAELLRQAQRPLLVCGGGPIIAGACDEVQQLAELLAAPVATSVSGQGVIADTHPLSLGVVGSNGGTPQTRDVLMAADTVVFIGCRAGSVTTERSRFPASGQCKILHIDVDPDVIGVNYATDAALVGDAKLALAALCEAIGTGASQDALQTAHRTVAAAKQEKFEIFREYAYIRDGLIRPETVIDALQQLTPAECIIVADPGTPCPYFSGYYEHQRAGRHFVTNRAHGALGYALPGVVGAQFARPNAKCIAVMGDGSFGFSCGEMETVVRYQLPITMLVISNAVFGWIKAGQKSGFDQRYFSVDFSRTDHARVAEAFGVKAWRVEDPEHLQDSIKQALATDGPALVDIVCQPLHEAHAPVSEWIS